MILVRTVSYLPTHDPVTTAPIGYSVVDLDASPFNFDTDQTIDVTLFEPDDVAVKDYSKLSYTEAFDKMYEIVRKEYAFNGIPGKAPDWDAVYAQIQPKVVKAQADKDAYEILSGFERTHP